MSRPIITPPQVVRFTIEGKLDTEKLTHIQGDIDLTAEENGRAQLLGEFLQFGSFAEFEQAFAVVQRSFAELRTVDRYAVITDQQWSEMIAQAENFTLPQVKMKVFEAVQRQSAIDWLVGKEV